MVHVFGSNCKAQIRVLLPPFSLFSSHGIQYNKKGGCRHEFCFRAGAAYLSDAAGDGLCSPADAGPDGGIDPLRMRSAVLSICRRRIVRRAAAGKCAFDAGSLRLLSSRAALPAGANHHRPRLRGLLLIRRDPPAHRSAAAHSRRRRAAVFRAGRAAALRRNAAGRRVLRLL